MWLHEETADLVQVYDALYQLGTTANYVGFFYTARAIWLCAQEPDRLLLVTKWLYPEVAEHYRTSWKAVERSIRSVIAVAWGANPRRLCEFAGYPLTQKPRPAQFLAIMVKELFPHCVA